MTELVLTFPAAGGITLQAIGIQGPPGGGGGGGVTDGDKGGIIVSGTGAVWTVKAGSITDLMLGASAIALFAAASHTHTIANITGLQAALDGKAATTHTHVAADVTDFAATTRGTVLTGYAAAGSRIALAAGDSILGAFGKLGKWVADLAAVAFSGSASDLTAGTLPAARFDDTAHGSRAGGALHAAATTSVAGFMSGADKTKLDGVETGANNYSHPNHSGDASSVGDGPLTLATVNANVGSFGLAGSVAQFVVNAKGLITSAVNVAISITASAISDSTAAGRAMLLAASAAAQTALLDTFTSGAKGLAPASGGGTTNFLRADGTWAAPAGGGGGASFPDLFEYWTDCYSAVADQVCQAYTSNGAAGIVAWPFAGNPVGSGFMRLSLNASASGRAAWGSANIANALYLRQGEANYLTGGSFITLSDGTNSYETNLGFVNDFTAAPTYGVFFRHNHAVNGGRWEAVTVAGGSPTVADTGVAATTDDMTIFGIVVNAAGTSVDFTIDGAVVTTITTTIPAAGINLGFGNAIRRLTGSGAVLAFLQDYIRCTQEFTGR